MKLWNQEAVEEAIRSVDGCTITHVTQPEDYVSGQIVVSVVGSEEHIFVRGFRTDNVQFSSDNQIEYVEVTSGYSDGGLPNDPDYVVTHAKVKAAIMRLDYEVVNSLDPYF